ncbi:MAG: cytochrome c1 [Candidatus Methylopumilus sp.]|jgi:ubiquinol-cytochrome c reductase cytochrome c1 subunit|nr:cytochrome c1 [Candidatus Methylopumilus sp.]NBW60766.1 cytochrome c1 [Methylophilaceae bacterium]
MKKFVLVIGLLFASLALANEHVKLDRAPIDPNNQASLQRGAKYFVNYCLNCHSAMSMRYNRLMDIGLTEAQIKSNLMYASEKVGDTMTVAMPKADAKLWFGATPPDLSVEARARGADWLYSYLRGFYRDSSRPTGWNNVVFDKVGMPHVLWQLQGQQVLKEDEEHHSHQLVLDKPGTLSPAQYDLMVADLVNYLVFMAEPYKQQDQRLGILVLLFLGLLLVLTYALKKEFWKDIH